MSEINDGGPAFPCGPSGMSISYDDGRTEHQYPGSSGMSLRDWLAGQVLQGLASDTAYIWNRTNEEVATASYDMADAMLKARSANE